MQVVSQAKPKPNKLSLQLVFSCFLASLLEIYDFAIFGFFSSTIYKNYLSFLDTSTALIVTYAFFAIGFVFRPLGSLIFGYIGDVRGRKIALVTSVSMMGLASFIMFALPPYSMIGILSCYLIVLVRIAQGISVGGEFTGAIIFAIEHSKENRVGQVAAIISAGGACGVMLANFVSKILTLPYLPNYSWRLAFLIGFTLSIVGYFIRKNLTESPVFKRDRKVKIPLFEGVRNYKVECLGAFTSSAANGVVFYFGSVYLYKLVSEVRGDGDYTYIPILVSFTVALLLPFFGMIADKVNRSLYLMISSFIMAIYSVSVIKNVIYSENTMILNLGIFVYAVIASMMVSGINIFAVENFPTEYRMSSSSLFYSLGMGFIGGTVPMVASFIVNNYTDSVKYITYYVCKFRCSFGLFQKKKAHMHNLR